MYEESTAALDKYIQKIKEKAMVEGARAKMEELAAKRAELSVDLMKKNEEIRQRREEAAERMRNNAGRPQTSSGAAPAAGVYESIGTSAELVAMERSRASIDRKLEETDKAIDLLTEVAAQAAKTVKNETNGNKTITTSDNDTRKYWEAELEARREKLKALREDVKSTAADIEKASQDEARKKLDNDNSVTSNLPIVGDIKMYQTTMEKLKELYAGDEQNHEAYLAAKSQATGQFCQDLAQKMQAAYQSVNQIMSAASSYFSAQQQYETAQVQAKYEKQIEAAGNNQAKVKKLQEKQKKEEAAIKNKYNRKAMAIEIAQAAASTAFNAIAAFGAVLQKGQPWTVPLAYAAAAAATAAGMLQIAAIKKQHAAEQAGYYEGGFTGGRHYRSEAGVVHEGEFVANHQAVNNPAIMPFLSFLDQAQRNNTVGSLTAQDVSRNFAPQQAPQVVAPVVNVQTDNTAINDAMGSVADTVDRLNQTIENGIPAVIYLDGNDGLMHRIKQYNRLQANK